MAAEPPNKDKVLGFLRKLSAYSGVSEDVQEVAEQCRQILADALGMSRQYVHQRLSLLEAADYVWNIGGRCVRTDG